jgi:hypothetical protein
LKVEEDDPTYYLSGYGQLETLRNHIEKKVGDRFLELYVRIKELVCRFLTLAGGETRR